MARCWLAGETARAYTTCLSVCCQHALLSGRLFVFFGSTEITFHKNTTCPGVSSTNCSIYSSHAIWLRPCWVGSCVQYMAWWMDDTTTRENCTRKQKQKKVVGRYFDAKKGKRKPNNSRKNTLKADSAVECGRLATGVTPKLAFRVYIHESDQRKNGSSL